MANKKDLKKQDGTDIFAPIVIATDRNRWFLLSFLLSLVIAFLVYDNIRLRVDRSDIDVAWVRLFPDGTWDISVNDSQDQAEFFVTTVNSLLTKFVKSRYGVNAYTIAHDYGVVQVFLSPELQGKFNGPEPDGFNAIGRAAEIADCALRCEQIVIKTRDIDHYDSVGSSIDTSTIYKTNIFIDELSSLAGVNNPGEKSIVSIDWRLLDKQSLLNKYPNMKKSKKAFSDYLNINPIGIEVIGYEKLVDPTEDNNNTNNN